RTQTMRSWCTLARLIWSSGLEPHESSVRRQLSQSRGSGFWIIASVTGEIAIDGGVTVCPAACASASDASAAPTSPFAAQPFILVLPCFARDLARLKG